MNASTGRATCLRTVPTISAAMIVLASLDMKEMEISVPILTSARFLRLLPSAWRMPSAATCRPSMSASVNRDSKAMDKLNVEISTSAVRATLAGSTLSATTSPETTLAIVKTVTRAIPTTAAWI